MSNLLQNVKITVYNNSNCPSNYSLQSNQICSGKFLELILTHLIINIYEWYVFLGELAGGKDTCSGDGGGPLFVQATIDSKTKFVLAGITSFGDGCAKVGIPG